MNIFGKRLTGLRKERGLAQIDIAGHLGMSRSGIQGYETEDKEPSYAVLCRIADYFDVSVDYLLGRSNQRRRPPRKPGPVTYNVRISCLQYGDTIVKANTPEEAKEKAELLVQSDAVKWFDSEITDMTTEEVEERTFTVTEFCPHCETEIEMRWDTDKQGFKAFCPSCGQRLMLCDECHQLGGGCDYSSDTDSCKFNPSHSINEIAKTEETTNG
ncbi:MAG: helix-turn-helix transcriptional regulator [Oscillospiraceae bacterium]|nr:helix-turn-helix transcriptional regulator [Oscillospiraceae bacterium]